MSQSGKAYVVEKVKEMMAAASCCKEAREAAQSWLAAIGTDREAELAKALVAELEEDLMSIDGLIAFADSEAGAQVFGAEKAKAVAAHGREIKEAGGKYCDCPACVAVAAILEKKEEILG
ncbi:MAG: molecular chaperone Hsp90 [Lachnospiraceae bacterium]|nr:molecular chaperone Hsp90 [Lachnospiraceae bacterium]